MKTCTTCGEQIKQEKDICGYCGAIQVAPQPEYASTTTPEADSSLTEAPRRSTAPKKSRALPMLLASGVLFVVAAAGSVIYLTSQGPGSAGQTASSVKPEASFTPIDHQVDTQAPTEGSCWQSSDFAKVFAEDHYKSGKKVDCSKSHDSVTFYLGSLPSDTKLDYSDDFPLESIPSNSAVRASVLKICGDGYSSKFSGLTTRLRTLFYIPDQFAWAAGARWVRCDVYAAKWGSTVGSPRAAVVQSDLAAIEKHYAKNDYQICLSVPSGQAPMDSTSVYTDCSSQWDFKLISESDLTSQYANYPGSEPLAQAANRFCSTAGSGLLAYYPSESGWSSGNTFARCWASAVDDSNN